MKHSRAGAEQGLLYPTVPALLEILNFPGFQFSDCKAVLCTFQEFQLCPMEWSWIGDPLKGRSRALYPTSSPSCEKPLGGDILGKEWGEIVQRCLWFHFGVGFFFPLSVPD